MVLPRRCLSQLEVREADPHAAPVESRGRGFGLLPKITHSLREVKWGTDPFLSVRDTVEFQCLRDRAMSAPILVYVSTSLF